MMFGAHRQKEVLAAMDGSDYRVCFYSPAGQERVDRGIPPLFAELQSAHGIESQVINLRLVTSSMNPAILVPDEAHEKEIYQRDFEPRWRVLNPRTGARVRKVLRSNSGRYCVAGTVAVLSGQGVEWYSVFSDRFASYDEDHRLGFLRALLANGQALLADLCQPS
jgi:hypothetical protein